MTGTGGVRGKPCWASLLQFSVESKVGFPLHGPGVLDRSGKCSQISLELSVCIGFCFTHILFEEHGNISI